MCIINSTHSFRRRSFTWAPFALGPDIEGRFPIVFHRSKLEGREREMQTAPQSLSVLFVDTLRPTLVFRLPALRSSNAFAGLVN